MRDEQFVVRTCCEAGVVLDERICDGLCFANSLKLMKRFFANSYLLEDSLEALKRPPLIDRNRDQVASGGKGRMKAARKIFAMCICLVLVCGCQPSRVPEGANENQLDEPVYLSGYPDDAVPLYQSVLIDNCRFTVREDLNYVIGKDFYSLSFESAGDPEDISMYYRNLMDEVDEDASYSGLVIEGIRHGHRVSVMIGEQRRDGARGIPVALLVGMPMEQYVNENPYFADYPEDIIEAYGFFRLQEYTYTEDYIYGYARYATVYQTREEAEAVTGFYREQYRDMPEFTESRENDVTVFVWEDGLYRCMVRYDAYPNIQFIQLLVDRDL